MVGDRRLALSHPLETTPSIEGARGRRSCEDDALPEAADLEDRGSQGFEQQSSTLRLHAETARCFHQNLPVQIFRTRHILRKSTGEYYGVDLRMLSQIV